MMSALSELREMLEDEAKPQTFKDDVLLGILKRENGFVDLVEPVESAVLYRAAYVGWIRKAGKVKVIKQKTGSSITQDTSVAYNAAIKQAMVYKHLADNEAGPGVQIPVLDTTTPFLDTTVVNGTERFGDGIKELI